MESLPENRPPPSLEDWLAEKRERLPKRLTPEEAVAEIALGAKLIDTRTLEQKIADGQIPGAIEIDLNVLGWRCHPASPYRDQRITEDYAQRLILLCNQGFSSSIAAFHLQELGLVNATDVNGGYEAWVNAGYPWMPYQESQQ